MVRGCSVVRGCIVVRACITSEARSALSSSETTTATAHADTASSSISRNLACSDALACLRRAAPKTAESSAVSLRCAATKEARAASRRKCRSTW